MKGLLKIANIFNILAEKPFTTEVDNPSLFETITTIILNFFYDLAIHLATLAIKIYYMIMKWVMTIIDFVYTLVRQLVGINPDSSGASFLIEDDIIFKFLSGEYFIPLMKYMLGFCLVLLIVFTIIAIIKSEYDYTVYGKDNSKKQVLVKSLQAVFMMILVPFIVIGSIIASNALLRTLVTATSLDGKGTSIGTQIFIASSYRANAYRKYADNNEKIPITYNFQPVGDDEHIAGWETDGGVEEINEVVDAYMNMPVWNRGMFAFEMQFYKDYYSLDYIDEITYKAYQGDTTFDENTMSIYEGFFDKGIHTYTPEYYIMADVIDEIFGQDIQIQFTTLEDVYERCEGTGIYHGIVKNGDYYETTIYYEYDVNGDGSVTAEDFVVYRHKKGATDEANGAVFICTTEQEFVKNDGTIIYYPEPYMVKSMYRQTTERVANPGTVTIARGTFSEDGYPTAIRIRNNIVECYRDNLNIPTLIDFFPTISYEKPEGTTEDLGSKILRTGFELITGVNPDELIPYVYYNFDLFSLFSKTTNVITKFEDGGLELDYYFADEDIEMENIYWIPSIDVMILTFSISIVFSIILKAMFGLIGRIFDIVVLIIIYPATLALFPIKGNKTFSEGWVPEFIAKLTGAYGIVIALNLMFVLAAATADFALLQPIDAKNSVILQILGVGFANQIFRILFLLVAFTMLQSIPKVVNEFITGQKDESDIISRGEKAVQDLKKPFVWVGDVVSGRFVGKALNTVKDTVLSSLPGGAIVARGIDDSKSIKFSKEDLAKIAASGSEAPTGGTGEETTAGGEGEATDGIGAGLPGAGGGASGATGGDDESGGEEPGEETAAEEADSSIEALDDSMESVEESVEESGEGDDSAEEMAEGAAESIEAAEESSESSDDGETATGSSETPATPSASGEVPSETHAESSGESKPSSEDANKNAEANDKPANVAEQTNTKLSKGVQARAQNFALVRDREYKEYLEKNNKEDNADSKNDFFIAARNEVEKGSEEQKRFARDCAIAEPRDNAREIERDRRYSELNKDKYQKFLQEKGMTDNASLRAIFFSTEAQKSREAGKDSEEHKKFVSDVGIIQPSSGRREATRAKMYSDMNKDGYQKFLQEKGWSDNSASRDMFFNTERDKVLESPENKEKWKNQINEINKSLDEKGIR